MNKFLNTVAVIAFATFVTVGFYAILLATATGAHATMNELYPAVIVAMSGLVLAAIAGITAEKMPVKRVAYSYYK